MSDIATQRRLRGIEDMLDRLKTMDRSGAYTGTWTPEFSGTASPGTFTYTVQYGAYTRLHDTVFIRCRVAISAVTVAPTGNLAIIGLPFAAAAVAVPGGISPIYWSVIGLGGGANVYLGGWIQSGNSYISLTVSQNAGGGAVFLTVATAALANGSDLILTGQYQV